MKTPVTKFRLNIFPDLDTANASTVLFGFGDMIAIIGDNTRFKMGYGYTISSEDPANPTGFTFADLPWIQSNGGIPSVSVNANVTAYAGGGQTNATQLAAQYNFVETVATDNDSVKIPPAISGMIITIHNDDMKSLAVFPAVGEQINDLAVNAADNIAGGITKTYICQNDGEWTTYIYNYPTPIQSENPVALNATGLLTPSQVAQGVMTSTSAAPVTATLPTATLLAAYLQVFQGAIFPWIVDNSAGASVVTVALGSGITQEDESLLTVPAGETAIFDIYFTGTTTAKISRRTGNKAADVAALTDNSTGTATPGTVPAVTSVGTAANAIATLTANNNAILAALKAAGIMA